MTLFLFSIFIFTPNNNYVYMDIYININPRTQIIDTEWERGIFFINTKNPYYAL